MSNASPKPRMPPKPPYTTVSTSQSTGVFTLQLPSLHLGMRSKFLHVQVRRSPMRYSLTLYRLLQYQQRNWIISLPIRSCLDAGGTQLPPGTITRTDFTPGIRTPSRNKQHSMALRQEPTNRHRTAELCYEFDYSGNSEMPDDVGERPGIDAALGSHRHCERVVGQEGVAKKSDFFQRRGQGP
jgi:hypothetical protein